MIALLVIGDGLFGGLVGCWWVYEPQHDHASAATKTKIRVPSISFTCT